MAPVMKKLEQRKIDYNFIFTGQHKETIDELIENFNLPTPDYILYSGKDITGIIQSFIWILNCLIKLYRNKKSIFKNDENGIVLTHGDTFSTVLGAIAGKIGKHKVAHVEAGLRSFDILHPFPEEINRLITTKLSDIYFAPGEWAVSNLKRSKGSIINIEANTLYDSLLMQTENNGIIQHADYCLVSIHRFENIFNRKRFKSIVELLIKISEKHRVVFILHKPTEINLKNFGFYDLLNGQENIQLTTRKTYFNFIKLLMNSKFLISDGGSNQEECYYLGKPCLILRKKSERTEGLGKNVVISFFNEKIIYDFIVNFKRYEFPKLMINTSPSQTIVEYLARTGYATRN